MSAGSRRTAWRVWATMGVVLAGVGCNDASAPRPGAPNSPFVISNSRAGGASRSEGGQGTLATGLVYVALPPGSFADASTVAISVRSNGFLIVVNLVDGGLDPLPVPASPGDTLDLEVRFPRGAPARYVMPVPTSAKPVVIRVSPPPKKRDVPLSTNVLVVFSEPIALSTLTTSTVQLAHGTAPVAGRLAFVDSAHLVAAFTPDALLQAESNYAITVTGEVQDLDGQRLEAPLTTDFTTIGPNTSPFIVSNPTSGVLSNGTVAPPSGATGVAYVSLPPGLIPDAGAVVIRVRPAGGEVTAHAIDGALDPIAIAARAGDVLDISVSVATSTTPMRYAALVPATARPQLVRRSYSGASSRSVSLNTSFDLVFSEPIDSASLNAVSVSLSRGATPQAGTLAFKGPAILTAVYTPTVPFRSRTDYALTLSSAIRDLDGESLVPTSLPFTSETVADSLLVLVGGRWDLTSMGGAPLPVGVTIDTLTGRPNYQYIEGHIVFAANGTYRRWWVGQPVGSTRRDSTILEGTYDFRASSIPTVFLPLGEGIGQIKSGAMRIEYVDPIDWWTEIFVRSP